ncbi:unnamed protein product [Adineta ricciae]|uniref:Uncharacterized protein n=1 Tax=Adineta ricciae TaxID=249248 RepID=A0A813T9L6_ADIRI|nr:unnamed protein product [Adineta ricciae]CAF1082634.1 unnamed protein product [Adineta ricciae]
MPRLCCFSRRKSRSFPVHGKQRDTEVKEIFIRNVESIHVTSQTKIIQQEDKIKTKSKATLKKNADDQSKEKEATVKNQSVRSRTSLSKLFIKPKQMRTPSPLPTIVDDKPADRSSLEVSISTDSDSTEQIKHSKHRSCADSYDISKEETLQKQNTCRRQKPTGKSKVILENVRKMIQDQNAQQQTAHL